MTREIKYVKESFAIRHPGLTILFTVLGAFFLVVPTATAADNIKFLGDSDLLKILFVMWVVVYIAAEAIYLYRGKLLPYNNPEDKRNFFNFLIDNIVLLVLSGFGSFYLIALTGFFINLTGYIGAIALAIKEGSLAVLGYGPQIAIGLVVIVSVSAVLGIKYLLYKNFFMRKER